MNNGRRSKTAVWVCNSWKHWNKYYYGGILTLELL